MRSLVERASVEEFLYQEAELIDSWRLNEWIALFTEDGAYMVHSGEVSFDASPDTTLFYIADDVIRLGGRIERLTKRAAIAEFPHSQVRHMIGNVLIGAIDKDNIAVTCNMMVHRWRDRSDMFVGRGAYKLVMRDGKLMIREKRVRLDSGDLRDQSRISIIL